MVEGKISLNTKKILLIVVTAAFLAALFAFPASANATESENEGKIKVSKKIDRDGDGRFDGYSDDANKLGFRWQLNGGVDNKMGDDVDDLALGSYTVTETKLKGYVFVGWYSGREGSCYEPTSTTYPVNVTLTDNNDHAYITLCNKRVGTITVTKQTSPHDDPTSFSLTASSSDGGTVYGDASTTIKDNGTVVFHVKPGYIYSVTETVPAGWTMNSNTCSNIEVGSKPVVEALSRTSVPANLDKECAVDNTKNPTPVTPVVQGTQVVAAPTGGVGAGSGGTTSSLSALLGLSGSLGALGFGLRQTRKLGQ